jgi:methyl-accepting chemotaxis protein
MLKESANTTAERVGAAISEIKHAGQEVASASSEISASTTDLSQRTEEQAASLEQTSASMEEMSVTVKKNAEQAKLANQYAGETRETADRSGQVVAEAVHAMSRIDESSKKIADIITVIDEIARQTNLLALNAAVEAARAGEAGRGFAVVASEVRSLAQRSSQAAKDIKDLITSSSMQVQEGVDLVNKAGGSLSGIVESIKKVAAIVSDIATASIEQSTGIDQVNKALGQVDEVTQQNSALVEENAATAKALEHQAATMNERMKAFRLDDTPVATRSAKPAAPVAAPAPLVEKAKPRAAAAKPVVQRKVMGGAGRGAAVAKVADASPDWEEF